MLHSKITSIFTVLLLAFGLTHAQKVLTLEEAVSLALENNHGIKVARNNIEISKNNAHPGNAGLLPRLDLNAGANYQNTNTTLEFVGDTPPIEQNGANANSQNASVALSYTLFDGLGTIYNFQRLKSLNENTRIQARLSVETTLMQVMNAYYTVSRQQEQLSIAEEAVKVSYDRWERAKEKSKFGVAKLDVLNAKVDLNTDSVTLASSRINFRNARRDLVQLLGNSTDLEFNTDENIEYESMASLESMLDQASETSTSVRLAEHNRNLAEYDLKTAKSGMYPRLDLSASYGYNRSESDASFVRLNTSLGFSGGVSLNWNIFNGRQNHIQRQNARLNMNSRDEELEDAVKAVQKDLENAFDLYQNSLFVLETEERNLSLSELNFSQTQERYGLGLATNTQLREAQLNLIRAKSRIVDLRITAKLAEIELVRLSGQLIQGE